MRASDQVLTVAQMVAAEQALIAGGETVDSLMQTAGKGAADWVWRVAARRPVTVLCGPGNNGGDGYVIAEAIRARGGDVAVLALMEPATDAARNASRLYKGERLSSAGEARGGVLVDCLFGSGLARPLSRDLVLLLRDLARSHRHWIAVDLPSGIESDSGAPLNEGLPPNDLTIALGAWKFAHFLTPASATMGAKRFVPIGVEEVEGAARAIRRPHLSAPAADAHKYSRGLLAVVGGEMPGAAILAASAAMHGGAGYVKLFAEAPPPGAPPELVTDTAPLAEALADRRIDVILIGPGLGRSEAAKQRLIAALASRRPAVLDADALVLLAPDMRPEGVPIIATPHEGELETLCRAFAIVAASKGERAAALAKASGMVVVAKGPDTVIAAPDGALFLADAATSWLSTAGTGDVLAGLAASRLATGAEPTQAACQAVWLHGEAARLAGPAFTAGDLARAVPAAMAACL